MTRFQLTEAQRLSAEFVPKREQLRNGTSTSENEKPSELPKASGTGFLISDTKVVTNYHVIAGAKRVDVKIEDGVFTAKILKVDKEHDIAILEIPTREDWLRTSLITIVDSNVVKLGQEVFTVGFPNILMQGMEPKLTKGEISSLAGYRDDPRYFQISVSLQPGNSGGPLVDLYGNLVGITSASIDAAKALKITGSMPQNVNYAIKSSYLLDLLKTIPKTKVHYIECVDELPSAEGHKTKSFEQKVSYVRKATVLILAY